ncbi:hypothetical protein [Sphingomonas rubra]|uniref:Uncharacterized protein n=1 Tax=Sphingomonas rubra TaxID=634430 RepID=A0A1I5PHT1_9SPHN|nr:hypothetical protein [Sphingomonas rubra]SFP33678.1 hypothetical protein SAMN04488241_10125 [Sphingomonas rubra]
MRTLGAALLLLAGCDRPAPSATSNSAGARLEAAAIARGLVVDPARATLVGVWAHDTDRLCVTGPAGGEQRVGAVVDYGEGQACSAAGTVRRSGERLRVSFGRDCRFDARFDGERIAFPAELPRSCDALCSGRASLSALTVDRLSDSASEAATLRGDQRQLLCGDPS